MCFVSYTCMYVHIPADICTFTTADVYIHNFEYNLCTYSIKRS